MGWMVVVVVKSKVGGSGSKGIIGLTSAFSSVLARAEIILAPTAFVSCHLTSSPSFSTQLYIHTKTRAHLYCPSFVPLLTIRKRSPSLFRFFGSSVYIAFPSLP